MEFIILMIGGKQNMKYIINSGIYSVDFKGTNNAEFNGTHPALILKSIKNPEMYYVIPLTSYTKERWKKYRKLLCCRIVSIESIARIDKMLIMHKNKIPRRWVEGDSLLVPTPNEISTVYNRVMEYMSLSINTSIEEYKKFYKNYETLYHDFIELLTTPSHESMNKFLIDIDDDLNISYSLNNVTNLSSEDIKRILWAILGKDNIEVTFDKCNNILLVKTKKNTKNVLTFMKWYDSIKLTEEHN